MASSKPIEVVVAIVLLLITAFLLLVVLFFNLKGTSEGIKGQISGGFKSISNVTGVPYTPSSPQLGSERGDSEDSTSSYISDTLPLGKNSCKDPKKDEDCPISMPSSDQISKENEKDLRIYRDDCILYDKYQWICQYEEYWNY